MHAHTTQTHTSHTHTYRPTHKSHRHLQTHTHIYRHTHTYIQTTHIRTHTRAQTHTQKHQHTHKVPRCPMQVNVGCVMSSVLARPRAVCGAGGGQGLWSLCVLTHRVHWRAALPRASCIFYSRGCNCQPLPSGRGHTERLCVCVCVWGGQEVHVSVSVYIWEGGRSQCMLALTSFDTIVSVSLTMIVGQTD